MLARRVVSVAALCAGSLAACGGGASPTAEVKTESAQIPASLPTPWHRHLDFQGGLSIGIPPHWKVHHPRRALLISSPDRLVAVSVTADRTPDARAVPLGGFARTVLAALPGYRRPLNAGAPRPFKGTPLDAVRVSSVGVAASGVPERVTLVALRRDHLASFILVAAANRHAPASELRRALAMARTLRDRPVDHPAG